MMDNLYLDVEDEEDVYSGFDNPVETNFQQSAEFQHAVRTSHGRRPPPTGKIVIGQRRLPTPGRDAIGTAMRGGPVPAARPMTAVRAAGFASNKSAGASFDPMNQSQAGPAPPLEQKLEDAPEEKIKQNEKKVAELIEESCLANYRGDTSMALDKAKEAGRKERHLVRQRETAGVSENVNLDLTYSVLFNLANQYAANEMYGEAINAYQVIFKNKAFTNAGRLKVNMGNIYFKQKNYSKAIKYYRMALDQVPNTSKELRIKIMQNIGVTFIKLDQYSEAVESFEHIMSEFPTFPTGFNLILCYYALNDRDHMKTAFSNLLRIDLRADDEDKFVESSDDKQHNQILEAIKNDSLRQLEQKKKQEAERCIKTAAKLISPAIEGTFSEGYDWCIQQVRGSLWVEISHDLEIDKALMYLKERDFQMAAESLKAFEKKDTKVASTAATNLSFLYFLEKDLGQADKYADVAMQADRYNPSALVNKGNILFAKNEFEKAREYYKEAVSIEASCVEGLYNMGLCHKRLGRYEESLDCFYKLHAILKKAPDVIYQIADVYDKMEDPTQATEWFMQLVSIVPNDPSIHARLGEIYDSEGDKSTAFQYHYDAYRIYPSNIEVIEWLGAYYIDSQFCEKAISYFERAAIIQPTQVKWQLMVASCHRRSGAYQQALEVYKKIHKRFPDNVECLKFLVRLCTDLGLKDTQDYANKLKKAEKVKDLREQRASSGHQRRLGSGQKSRNNSAGSERGGSGTGARQSSGTGARQSSGKSGGRSAGPKRHLSLDGDGDDEPYQMSQKQEVDSSYSDPLGPQAERPRTAARRRNDAIDEFEDEELGDDLLPE